MTLRTAKGSHRRVPANAIVLASALLLPIDAAPAQAAPNPLHQAYYGAVQARWSQFSTLAGLVAAALPVMFSVSEFDGVDFQKQAALLVDTFARTHGRFPPMHWLAGHNHVSPVLAVGTPDDTLGPLLRDFIATVIA